MIRKFLILLFVLFAVGFFAGSSAHAESKGYYWFLSNKRASSGENGNTRTGEEAAQKQGTSVEMEKTVPAGGGHTKAETVAGAENEPTEPAEQPLTDEAPKSASQGLSHRWLDNK